MRTHLGSWGAELSDADFAMALAAAGILHSAGRRTPVPPLAESLISAAGWDFQLKSREPTEWRFPSPTTMRSLPPPRALADAWAIMREGGDGAKVRLQIESSPGVDGSRLANLLDRSLGIASLFFQDEWMNSDVDWRWPLRIGYLPGSRSRTLGQALADTKWPHLYDLFEISPARESCDILLTPSTVEGFADVLEESGVRVDANCVICLNGSGRSWRRLVPMAAAAAGQAHASGIAAVDVGSDVFAPWMNALVQHLSHDEPIDLALAGACAEVGLPMPLLIAHPELVRASRASIRAQALNNMIDKHVEVAMEPAPR
jgi:hypothetical protein